MPLLEQLPRVIFEADLRPAAGERFQPTGFADLGAAEYKLPDDTPMLLVESAQSVANRLEKTCILGEGPDIDPALNGLSYIVAELEGADTKTSSLIEAHRLASPYFVGNKTFAELLTNEMALSRTQPLKWEKVYATVFKYDANSLIHGVFLSLLAGGRVRVPRAVTGFIEARNVKAALSGGVKNSSVDPSGSLQVADPAPDLKSGEKGVYSNVPYGRKEYVAEKITAYFNVDLGLIRGYRLGDNATKLLTSLALLKIRRFVDSSLRLRTACDFELVSAVRAKAPGTFELPDEPGLLADVQAGIKACAGLFADPPVTTIKTPVVKKAEKEKSKEANA